MNNSFKVGLGNPIETNLGPMKQYGVLNSDGTVRHSFNDTFTAVKVASSLNQLSGFGSGVQTTLPMFNNGNPFQK
jgi:hypothetical protein